MKKEKEVCLYNVIFPIWLFFLWPSRMWLILLPVNLVIDSLVFCLTLKFQKVEKKFPLWKRYIFSIWLNGFICDLAGAALIYVLALLIGKGAIPVSAIYFPGTTLISLPGVALAGFLIYYLNKSFTFKKSDLPAPLVKKVCLSLAVFTAPYAMLIPING